MVRSGSIGASLDERGSLERCQHSRNVGRLRGLTSGNDSFETDHLADLVTTQGSRVTVLLAERSAETDVD